MISASFKRIDFCIETKPSYTMEWKLWLARNTQQNDHFGWSSKHSRRFELFETHRRRGIMRYYGFHYENYNVIPINFSPPQYDIRREIAFLSIAIKLTTARKSVNNRLKNVHFNHSLFSSRSHRIELNSFTVDGMWFMWLELHRPCKMMSVWKWVEIQRKLEGKLRKKNTKIEQFLSCGRALILKNSTLSL